MCWVVSELEDNEVYTEPACVMSEQGKGTEGVKSWVQECMKRHTKKKKSVFGG